MSSETASKRIAEEVLPVDRGNKRARIPAQDADTDASHGGISASNLRDGTAVDVLENSEGHAEDGETPAGSSTGPAKKKKNPRTRKQPESNQKKVGRRRRGTRNQEDADREAAGEERETSKAPRYPKRQCALLVGFCGSGYSGMQIQPDHTKTIEGVLFKALVKAGAVSQDNADDPVKVNLARAARTDAGVHAAGNVVSLKMIMDIPGVNNLTERINEELPPEIRLWGYVRTQNSFNARLVCDSRKYTYFFPSYLLIPPKPGSGLYRALQQHATQSQDPDSSETKPTLSEAFWTGIDSLSAREEDLLRKREWRVRLDQLEKLRNTALKFEGTHNFHNFTVSREFSDRSNHRFMKKIEIGDPVVYGGTEWISVLFHGQSFMLHQRKMMSALVLSCRCDTPEQIIDELYGPRDVFIPKMPALGLLLEEPLFHSYNGRMATVSEKFQPTDNEYRPPIDFDIYRKEINAFKEVFIYKNMREVENRDGIFDAWIRALDAYAGNDLLYLGNAGTIPALSIIKKGERRDNPFKEKKIFDATSFPVSDNAKKTLAEEEESEEEAPIDKKHLAEMEG